MAEGPSSFVGINLPAGKRSDLPTIPEGMELKLTMAALAGKGRAQVIVSVDGKEYTLLTLDSEKGVFQQPLELIFSGDEDEITRSFVVKGNANVDLTGYCYDTPDEYPYDSDSDMEEYDFEEGDSEEEDSDDDEEAPELVPSITEITSEDEKKSKKNLQKQHVKAQTASIAQIKKKLASMKDIDEDEDEESSEEESDSEEEAPVPQKGAAKKTHASRVAAAAGVTPSSPKSKAAASPKASPKLAAAASPKLQAAASPKVKAAASPKLSAAPGSPKTSGKLGTFVCEECGNKTFLSPASYNQHMAAKHGAAPATPTAAAATPKKRKREDGAAPATPAKKPAGTPKPKGPKTPKK